MSHRIYIAKSDVKEGVWESLCEIALGYPIDDSHELLDVVSIDATKIVPCEPKSTVYEEGGISTHWVETTKEDFRNA